MGCFVRGLLDGLLCHMPVAPRRILSAIGEHAETRHDEDDQSECGKRRPRSTDARDSGHDVLINVGSLSVFKRRAKICFLTVCLQPLDLKDIDGESSIEASANLVVLANWAGEFRRSGGVDIR